MSRRFIPLDQLPTLRRFRDEQRIEQARSEALARHESRLAITEPPPAFEPEDEPAPDTVRSPEPTVPHTPIPDWCE